MTTVRMLRDRQGSPDGIRTQWYREGQTYELPLSLAKDFLELGDAIESSGEASLETLETPKQEYAARKKGK
jgi:hypothetical protein